MIDKLGEDKQFIELIKTGAEEKSYYEIKYIDRVTGKTHIGYSSYNLEVISDYLRNEFMNQSQWHKVEDELPKEYQEVIVHTDADETFIADYLGLMNDGVPCFDDNNGMMCEGDVVAWMELPEWKE